MTDVDEMTDEERIALGKRLEYERGYQDAEAGRDPSMGGGYYMDGYEAAYGRLDRIRRRRR